MNFSVLQHIKDILKEKRKNKICNSVTVLLSFVTISMTIYFLMYPAVAMSEKEQEKVSGMTSVEEFSVDVPDEERSEAEADETSSPDNLGEERDVPEFDEIPTVESLNAEKKENISETNTFEEVSEVRLLGMLRSSGELELKSEWITKVFLQRRRNEWEPWSDAVVDSEGKLNVKIGDLLRLKLNYEMEGNQLSNEKKTVVYQLPEGLKSVKETSGKVYSATMEETGTYEIGTDGKLKITFNDDYVQRNANGEKINGGVTFECKVEDLNTGEGDHTELIFNDYLKIDIKIEDMIFQTDDLKVEKTPKIIDFANGIIEYKVKVSSIDGTDAEVHLEDIMQNIQYLESFSVVDKYGHPILTEGVSAGSSNIKITLPKMNKGQFYVLTYRAKVPGVLNGKIDAKNNVTVVSLDKQGRKLKDNVEISVPLENFIIKKSADKSSVQIGEKIKWTVDINTSNQQMNGWTLSDKMFVPMGGSWTLEEWMTSFENMKLKNKKTGEEISITLPYTFSNTMDSFELTYETTADSKMEGRYVKNQAILEIPDKGKITTEKDVHVSKSYPPPGEEPEMIKIAGKLTVLPDGEVENKTAEIEWTVRMSAGEGEIKIPWALTDEALDGQWFTEEQMQGLELQVKRVMGSKRYFFQGTKDKDHSDRYTSFILSSDKDSISSGEIIELTYKTTVPLEDGLSEKYFRNKMKLKYDKWKEIEDTPTKTYYPIVKKLDARKFTEKPTQHDYYKDMEGKGLLKWEVQVHIPEENRGKQVLIKEILPPGIKLVSDEGLRLRISGIFNGPIVFLGNSGKITSDSYEVTVLKQSEQEILLTIPPNVTAAVGNNTIYLEVEAKIDDDLSWDMVNEVIQKKTFENKVEIFDDSSKKIGNASQIQVITKNDNHNVLKKEIKSIINETMLKDNILSYTITVNPDGKDLIPGADTLLLKDRLSYQHNPWYENGSITLIPNSVKVYYRNSDGSKGDLLDKKEYPYQYKEEKPPENTTAKLENKLDITIPDKTGLIVEYAYAVYGKFNKFMGVINRAELEGISGTDGDGTTSISFSISDVIATADITGITLCKVDNDDNGLMLPDAEFKLYKWDGMTYQIVIDAKTGKEIYISGADGKVTLSNLSYNTAYKLVEEKPPSGYLKNTEPYFFYVKHEDLTVYPWKKPVNFVGVEHKGSGVLYYPNIKETTEIVIKKNWQKADGSYYDKEFGEIKINLYRKETSDDKFIGNYVVRAADKWKLIISNLERYRVLEDGTKVEYRYYIREKMDGEEYDISYENNAGIAKGTITVTNRNKNTIHRLPDTGGAGKNGYATGVFLTSISGYFLFRKKRKRIWIQQKKT